jgi:hypothetical protein
VNPPFSDFLSVDAATLDSQTDGLPDVVSTAFDALLDRVL